MAPFIDFAFKIHTSTTRPIQRIMMDEADRLGRQRIFIYYPPENFTKHCNSMDPGFEIGRRPCSHSVCVTVIEPQILAGQHVGNNVIRGCFSSVFKYGETPSFSGVADTNCTLIPMRKLLPANLASRAGNRRVQMCWCVGRLCNDYPTVSSSNDKSQHGHIQVFHLIITCLLCLMSKL